MKIHCTWSILLFFFLSQLTPGKTYYIDNIGGNDSYSGQSTTAAWKSISKVNSFSFSPGDYILFKRGGSWSGTLTPRTSGTSSSPITFGSFGTGNRPIINGPSGTQAIQLDNRTYLIVKDFNTKYGFPAVRFTKTRYVIIENMLVQSAQMGMYGDHADYLTIRNTTIENSTQSHGIYYGGGCNYAVFENNIVRNNAKSGIHTHTDALGTTSNYFVIRYNQIYGNKYYGLMNTSLNYSKIYYNLFYDNEGLSVEFVKSSYGGLTNNNEIYNNVFYNSKRGVAVLLGPEMKGNVFRNNIFVQGSEGVYLINDKTNNKLNTWSNNIYYCKYSYHWVKNNKAITSLTEWANLTGETNSQFIDPKFVNVSLKDFRLQSTSPAIAKGIYLGLTRDIAGTTVASSVKPNIGAYQLTGTQKSGNTEMQDNFPYNFSLNQNYPNPFNPETKIVFTIANEDMVQLKIYDVLGKEVATLINERMEPGEFTVSFNASSLSSGVYLCRLVSGSMVQTRKMILQK